MSTSKPISTISYNTEAFLRTTLENLIKGHTISDYYFIPHQADTDDLKDHIHVWVQPNRSLDTMTLQEAFKEIDPNNLEHPLGCISFRPSKLDDWILYGLHLQPYLEAKASPGTSTIQPLTSDSITRTNSDTTLTMHSVNQLRSPGQGLGYGL